MDHTQELEREIIDQYAGSEREVEVPFILDHLPNLPATILDIGCCESLLLRKLNDMGFNAEGIDTRDTGYENYPKFTKADARDIPFTSESFDIVICVSALEHFGYVYSGYHSDEKFDPDAQRKSVAEMKRVLKYGGQLLVTLPYGKFADGKGYERWIRFYDREAIEDIFGDFVIKDIKFSIQIDGQWQDSDEQTASQVTSQGEVQSNVRMDLRKI